MYIGVVGLAGSGKDTVADYFVKCGIVSSKYAFAEPIKRLVNSLFNWGDGHSDGKKKEKRCLVYTDESSLMRFTELYNGYGLDKYMSAKEAFTYTMFILGNKKGYHYSWMISPRKAYQLFGTEFGREKLSDTVWLDIAPSKDVIISDVRFQNEFDLINENQGLIIRVHRDNKETSGGCKDIGTSHESEQLSSKFETHLTIFNNGSLSNLYDELDLLICFMKKYKVIS